MQGVVRLNREQLNEIFKEIDENKKKIVQSMFDDFIYENEMIEELKPQIQALKNPKSQKEADKLKYFMRMYSDISQRHDGKIKIFLSALDKFDTTEDNPMIAWLKERQKK